MTAAMSIDIQVMSSAAGIPSEGKIRSWIGAALERIDTGGAVEISLRIVDEDEGRALNKTYRGKDKATNVLSFPSGIDAELPAGLPRPLGDVVICAPLVRREAAEQGKTERDHWAHLLVHGTLHLLGYDHESAREAEAMEALEREILAGRGVADPYAA